jgi:nucleotide-binding universal stress UspA family protein
MPRELIVVGVDGSENSRQALRWAVEEAPLTYASTTRTATEGVPRSRGDRPDRLTL